MHADACTPYNYYRLLLTIYVCMATLMLSPRALSHAYIDEPLSLYLASKNGRDQEVLSLLQSGYSPNSDYDSLPHTFQTRPVHTREHGRETPLHMACAYNHFRSAELLIKFGAIVAATDNIGWTPLHWASANNSEATAKLLLQHHCPTGEQGSIQYRGEEGELLP